jgi:tRNA(adenine34) deaminase
LYILNYITPVAQLERAADYGSAGWRFDSSQAYLLPKEFMRKTDDDKWMREALREAEESFRNDEVPVGAVVVKDGIIIGRGYNRKEALKDPTAHAEIIAITAAANSIGDWRLEGGTLYCTLEPCLMCAGAVIQARISRVVYGAGDEKFGAFGSVIDVRNKKWNWKFEVISGVLKEDSVNLLKKFFKKRRDG